LAHQLVNQRSWQLSIQFARLLAVVLLAVAPQRCDAGDGETTAHSSSNNQASAERGDYETVALRGRVVWLAEALKRRYGIQTDDDAAEAMVALETEDGRLYPIAKDARGRAFHKDERIRNINVELLARRFTGSPVIQVIRVYTLHDGHKYELDYWCDVCSISMFELKECECCQGPIRIRERFVEPTNP